LIIWLAREVTTIDIKLTAAHIVNQIARCCLTMASDASSDEDAWVFPTTYPKLKHYIISLMSFKDKRWENPYPKATTFTKAQKGRLPTEINILEKPSLKKP